LKRRETACFNSGQRVEDHFEEITEMIEISKGGNVGQVLGCQDPNNLLKSQLGGITLEENKALS
jgi:hypothetical protein